MGHWALGIDQFNSYSSVAPPAFSSLIPHAPCPMPHAQFPN
ncbi:MAG: hypothetical protein V7L05_32175 [Nostoc sp.]